MAPLLALDGRMGALGGDGPLRAPGTLPTRTTITHQDNPGPLRAFKAPKREMDKDEESRKLWKGGR